VVVQFDNPDPSGDPLFARPLEIVSYRRPVLLRKRPNLYVYGFSYRTADHPRRPGIQRSVSAGEALAFSRSAWRCTARLATVWLTCRDTDKASTAVVSVIPSRRLVEVETATKPVLLSGNGGPTAPYLYWFES
jgi:hypothetical protein